MGGHFTLSLMIQGARQVRVTNGPHCGDCHPTKARASMFVRPQEACQTAQAAPPNHAAFKAVFRSYLCTLWSSANRPCVVPLFLLGACPYPEKWHCQGVFWLIGAMAPITVFRLCKHKMQASYLRMIVFHNPQPGLG